MFSKLPKPITDYLDADKAKDADRLALCFAGDALVHDEGRDYRGRDAIRSWKQETKGKYKYVVELLDASVTDKTTKLRARLTGDFPGSPVELYYTFTVANDKIITLDIQ